MEADPITQAARAFNCSCGRTLQVGAVYGDACGQRVAYTGKTIRLAPLPATGATTRLHPPVLFANHSKEEAALLLDAIRDGMIVRSWDGQRLGKVRRVYVREPEVYLYITPEMDRWKPWLDEKPGLYIPASAIVEVANKQVVLSMLTKAAKGCTWRPSWIPREVGPDYPVV